MRRALALAVATLLALVFFGACTPFDARPVAVAAFKDKTHCTEDEIESVEPLEPPGFRVSGCGLTRYYWCNQKCCFNAKSEAEATASWHEFNLAVKCQRDLR